MRCCAQRHRLEFLDYFAFERFCLDHSAEFWTTLLEWSGLLYEGSVTPAITDQRCEYASFFPELRLNYVENLLRLDGDEFADWRPALTAVHSNRPPECWRRGQLRQDVAALAAALSAQGLTAGSRVAIIAANNPAAIIACLGAAAIGCVVSTGSPDLGSLALSSRLSQVEPVLLMAELGDPATPAGRQQRERVLEVARALPSLRGLLLLDEVEAPPGLSVPLYRLSDWLASDGANAPWPRLPFNHPLYILFTSGTTGAPKCLVHGAGGTLLEHFKEHRLHCGLEPSDRLFFQTSTGWMMWNWQLSALACGTELVLYDGPVTGPDTLWRIAAEQRVTVLGTSPAYLQLCQRGDWKPDSELDFSVLRAVLSTGSILFPRQQDWVWDRIKPLAVQSISGGTDIVGCFVLGNPNLAPYSAECQSRSLGLDVRALGAESESGRAPIGELVCANPFPSRPLGLLHDPDGSRFHAAYFAANPGFWTHGDLIEFTAQGSARMHGRSDGVLNIRGIRIGPAEIYRILEPLPEIVEAMAVELDSGDEAGGAQLLLLLVLRQGLILDAALSGRIKRQLSRHGSAAHVPARILAVDQLPATHSGKRSERSACDAINGRPVTNAEALRNPECLAQLRQAVCAPAPHRQVRAADPTLLETMQRIWEQILDLAPIDPHENYFDLGGDSFKALQIALDLKRLTGVDLPLPLLFEAPTIAGLCAALEAERRPAYRPLVLLREGRGDEPGVPLFIVHGVGGSVMELRELVQQIDTTRPVYALQARGFNAGDRPLRRVEDMAVEYLAAIREVQPRGPYLLAGYSFGGLVAYEMASRLRREDAAVCLLLLIDTITAERYWPAAAWREYLLRRLRSGVRGFGALPPGQRAAFCCGLLRALHERLRRAWYLAPRSDDMPGAALAEPLRSIRAAGLAAADRYQPRPCDVELTLLYSDLAASKLCDPRLIWRPLVSRLTAHDAPGDHETMVRKPHASELAAQLSRSLHKVR